MCAGAIVLSRVARVVFGAKDRRWGACGSIFHVLDAASPDVKTEVIAGVCEQEAADLLQEFFRNLRAKRDQNGV